MDRTQILKKQKKLKKNLLKPHNPFKSKELRNSKLVADTLLDCIRTGDTESFREVLTAHLLTVNKSLLAKKSGLSRRTLYTLIDQNNIFNPELSTITAIIQSLNAA